MNYLKSAGFALASYAALAGATPTVADAQPISQPQNLEYRINSGLGIYSKDNFGKSSYRAKGAHGIQNFKLYSNNKETKAKIAVALDIDESVYDIRNEHKTEASILIIPEGSELEHPAIDPKKEASLYRQLFY